MNYLQPWTLPSGYAGRSWHGWLVAPVSQTRDSGALDRSNWTAFNDYLERVGDDREYTCPATGEPCSAFEIVHERHWAVGWVEWLAIHPMATAVRDCAEATGEALEAYPVLDEDALCNLEWEEYQESWESYGRQDFIGALADLLTSQAAIDRLDLMDEGHLEDSLRELYQDSIPSGEFYYADGDGVALNIDLAAGNVTRDDLANLLKVSRAA